MIHRLKRLYFDTLFRLKRICLFVFSGLLLISVALMLIGGLMIYRATSDWRQTKGELLKFNIRPLEGHPSHRKLEVAFRYSVGNANYKGRHLSSMTRPGTIPGWRARHKQNQYRVGREVSVIYDPEDPSHAYLETPDLFWDVLLVPISIGGLGFWLLYLFVKTKRRKVPNVIAGQSEFRFEDSKKWRPIMEAVIERDHIVLQGIAAYSAAGGLLAGWPQSQVALVASPYQFAVVPGPCTKRGFASSVLTLVLEFSLSRFWLPAVHGTLFLIQIWRRRRNWKQISEQRFSELLASNNTIHLISIDDAVVYGYEPGTRRLWYRLPGQIMDEFIQLPEGNAGRADELIAYISVMQNAKPVSSFIPE